MAMGHGNDFSHSDVVVLVLPRGASRVKELLISPQSHIMMPSGSTATAPSLMDLQRVLWGREATKPCLFFPVRHWGAAVRVLVPTSPATVERLFPFRCGVCGLLRPNKGPGQKGCQSFQGSDFEISRLDCFLKWPSPS